jgi:hypothetical protein
VPKPKPISTLTSITYPTDPVGVTDEKMEGEKKVSRQYHDLFLAPTHPPIIDAGRLSLSPLPTDGVPDVKGFKLRVAA